VVQEAERALIMIKYLAQVNDVHCRMEGRSRLPRPNTLVRPSYRQAKGGPLRSPALGLRLGFDGRRAMIIMHLAQFLAICVLFDWVVGR